MWIFFRLCTVYPIWIPYMLRPSLVSLTFPTSKKKYLTTSKVPKLPKKLPPIHGPSTEEHAKTQVEILCFLFSLNSLRFPLTREIDKKMTSQKLSNLQNINSWMIKFNKLQICFFCITVNFIIYELNIFQFFCASVSLLRETLKELRDFFHKIPSPALKDGLDVLVTGHEDGSVKFWNCSSIALSLMATIKTGRYLSFSHLSFSIV